ncbi:ABC transporter permease [Hymenobacter sp. BT770]|uniref:ABC transporter permease n=1 Tax=Hymenobacter sp. BT770 TaxID=2886942 RepID=UPI001D12B84C|nr:ABC transporter permease [Hymenobacter sp. BT770]MCC3153638.1 ABC transporter permease [Hymenobacter sp. BT770]MDO3415896.1 ABC transporter permease [Hymenobacter sp. BT770]
MLLNYLKIAWKVLLRRKFFTFISLFGISFTLMIMLVVVAFVNHVVGAEAPQSRIDRMLFVSSVRQQMFDGGNMNMPASIFFIDRYVRTLKTPELVGLTSISSSATSFANNQSLTLDVRYTDGNFWKISDFAFLGGRPFNDQEVKNADRVCVINEHTARAFFGTAQGVAGRTIEVGPHRYRVTGVVPDVPIVRVFTSSDIWVPYTLNPAYFRDSRLGGEFIPIILARSTGEVPAVREEFQQVVRRIEIPNPKEIKQIFAHADSALGSLTRELTMHQSDESDGMGVFLLACAVLGLLFMLLPALNLVNLNVTRILERSSEIGVRKAFGASGSMLVGQFLVENLVLTSLGGLLGLGLAAVALRLLNDSHLFTYAQFGLNWQAFGWALGLAAVFGLMSGVYPAWKMSRLNPVDALRGSGGGPQ